MKKRSKYIPALLNILVMLMTMNATLAHSICTMSAGGSSVNTAQTIHSSSAEMPCHQLNRDTLNSNSSSNSSTNQQTDSSVTINLEPANAEASSPNQCCSDCSVFSLPMDTEKAIAPQHSSIASAVLMLTISRSIELPFRPPINLLA